MVMTLKAARVNAGLTQQQAAEKLHKSSDTIRNWEKSKSFPNVSEIGDIEKLYGITYNDILFLPKNHGLNVNQKEMK